VVDKDLHATTETKDDEQGWLTKICMPPRNEGQSVDGDLHSTMETRDEDGGGDEAFACCHRNKGQGQH